MAYRRKRKYSGRRRKKSRGIQRIKTYRYRARNIGGDNAFAKLRYTIGTTRTIPTGASFVASNDYQITSGNDLFNLLGSTPGLSTLASQFTQYRIYGIKLKFTAWPSDPAVPVVMYTNAAATPLDLITTPNSSNLPEQRWARYKVCNPTTAGARPSTMTVYYSTKKIVGPDVSVKTDLDYTGTIAGVSPYWSVPPPKGPFFEYGAYTMSGLNPTVAINIIYKIEATLYAKFWGKKALVQ